MTHDSEWRRSREANRFDAIGRLLRAQFDQIAKAPAPALLIALADRLEAKTCQSEADLDDDDDVAPRRSRTKPSDA